MIGWLILLTWLIGWFVSWPRIAKWLLDQNSYGEPDTEDKLFAAGIGFILALVWFLVAPVSWMAGKL